MATHRQPLISVLLRYILVSAALVKGGISFVRIVTTEVPDFAYYYRAAAESVAFGARSRHLLPPLSVVLYLPLLLLPYGMAQVLWTAVSFGCLVASVWLIGPTVGMTKRGVLAAAAAAFFFSFPARFTLGMGQVNLMVLAILAYSLVLERRKQSGYAGLVCAAAVLLKPELSLLIPVIVWKGSWRMVAAACVGIVGMLSVSLMLWGTEAYMAYGTRFAEAFASSDGAGIYYNQSLYGMWVRSGLSMWLYGAVIAGMMIRVWMSVRRSPGSVSDALWRAMPMFILTEPIAWQHHFVFLLPAYLYAWTHKPSGRMRALLCISYALVSWNVANPAVFDTMRLGWIFASHATVGAIVLWFLVI